MSCAYSREQLALHVEGDLSDRAASIVSRHVAACDDCRKFLEQLRSRQSLLKSLRRETASPSECTAMRREVMAIVNDRQERSGWALRLERAILLGLRQRSYALVACALLGIVSVSVLAQMRRTSFDTKRAVAVFEGRDTLIRPEGYRDWIFVGSSEEPRRAGIDHDPEGATRTPTHGVYIDPSGYREYAKTGTFPEGTLMVWESVRQESQTAHGPHRPSSVLLASVKDSARFEGGWGFFDFSGIEGRVKSKAQVLPESSGCRACHREDAATDHVFTQFYPILRSARRLERREAHI